MGLNIIGVNQRLKQAIWKFILVIVIVFPTNKSFAQSNIGIKYFGLSIHPYGEEENAFLLPNKLDSKGYLVLNIGGEIMWEHFIYKDLISVKVIQALYADCAARFGGFSHIGLRSRIFKKGKHRLHGGIGPTLAFRRNWIELEGYVDQNRFDGNASSRFQYLFLWYGGEFEYKYEINENLDFAISLIPGYPDLISLAFGVSYRWKKI